MFWLLVFNELWAGLVEFCVCSLPLSWDQFDGVKKYSIVFGISSCSFVCALLLGDSLFLVGGKICFLKMIQKVGISGWEIYFALWLQFSEFMV